MMKYFFTILIALQGFGCANIKLADATPGPLDGGPAKNIRRYNVVWTSPSKDASGVMPIGNGDLAAGVYAITNDDLYLLLAKNDAFNSSGEIYKSGRVCISLKPNPFQKGEAFVQTLDLATGSITIEADDVKMRVWIDANNPVCHVQIDAADEIEVQAVPEFWDRLDGTKDQLVAGSDQLLWYFAVGETRLNSMAACSHNNCECQVTIKKIVPARPNYPTAAYLLMRTTDFGDAVILFRINACSTGRCL